MQQAVRVILEEHRHSDEQKTDKNLKDREKYYIETMKMLADEGIDGYVADNRFRKRDPKFAGTDKYKERTRKEMARISGSKRTFGVDEFQFPDDLSYCICPAGKRLYRSGGNTYTKGKHAVRFKGPNLPVASAISDQGYFDGRMG